MRTRLRNGIILAGLAGMLSACGDVPETTEQARGLIGDAPPALALAVAFVVFALAIIFGAIAIDRYVRSRQALEQAPSEPSEPEEEEEEEPVVAGIGQGSAAVPKWLYAFYAVIPIFALMYIVNAVAFEQEVEPEPEGTPAPTQEVSDTVEIAAEDIQFDTDEMVLPANTEVTIVFENRDSAPHNVAVYGDDSLDEEIFVGEIFSGPEETVEYTFTTPGPGEYYFHCDVHPSMNGVVEVVEAGGEEPAESEGGPETEVEIAAEDIQFDTDEIVVPAGEEITIVLENRDSVPHNVAVYGDDSLGEEIFVGELFSGPEETMEYTFTAPEPGEYYFQCDVHPSMDGAFVAE